MRYKSNYRSKRSFKSKNNLSFLMPFFILLSLILIIVLVVKLWMSLVSTEADRGVQFLAISGEVQVKPWGTETYLDIPSGSYVMEGDEILCSEDARLIMEFPDGTIMRVDGETDFVLEEMDFEDDMVLKIMLVHGQLWFNKLYKNTETDLSIKTANLLVRSETQDIFDVENKLEEVVRVMKGNVFVDISDKESDKIVETVQIAVGQEVVFLASLLEQYWEYMNPPNVVDRISDEFNSTAWYKWNVLQDKKPSVSDDSSDLDDVEDEDGFVDVDPENLDDVEDEGEIVDETDEQGNDEILDTEETDNVEDEVIEEEDEETVGSSTLSAPKISSVAGVSSTNEFGYYVVSSNLATLVGSVEGAANVFVNDYQLKQFSPGDSSWTYYANADYGLMQEGENVYKVYAEDSQGNKSSVIEVKVFYKPAVVVEQNTEEVVEEEIVEEEPVVEEEEISNEEPEWLTKN